MPMATVPATHKRQECQLHRPVYDLYDDRDDVLNMISRRPVEMCEDIEEEGLLTFGNRQ